MTPRTVDAIVIGAGHHGLVAAALLADAGWDVVVAEGRSRVGGAVASSTIDGFVVDEFSSCYPLGRLSPVLRALDLGEHGLEWVDHRPPLAHVSSASDELGSLIAATLEETATLLDADHPGDGDAWLRLYAGWQRVRDPLLAALFTGWPPVGSGLRLAKQLGAAGLLDFSRFALLPAHQLGEEWFSGQRARELISGNAVHADVSPLSPPSGFLGFLLAMAAQDTGFPMPAGGASHLAEALASRARAAGTEINLNLPVTGIAVADGTAVGVRLGDGSSLRARRAVVADVTAQSLYRGLLSPDAVPAGLLARLARFGWDPPTLKLNLMLDSPMPWQAHHARQAAVVHAGLTATELTGWNADITAGRVPERPFAIVGQTTTADPSRSPAGTESLWAYTHLPPGEASERLTLERLERMFDDLAPGWRELETGRWLQTPGALEDANPNLVGGAVTGGSAQLFQQGPWRPIAGLGGPTTHLRGLFLASAATHPGGAVHGGAGFNAARAALREASWWARPLNRSLTWAQLRLQRTHPAF